MKKISRRDFMKVCGGATLALGLTACGAPAGSSTGSSAGSASTAASGAAAGAVENYTWGSASMGGSAQLVITAIGTLVNDKDPTLNINVQSTGGSMENPRLLRNGDIDIAHTGEPYNAYFGEGRFEADGPMPEDTMVLMKTYPAGGLFVVKSDSPVQKMEDLKGKSIYLGPPAGMIDQVKLLLEYYDINEDNSEFVVMGYNDGADALKDGTVEAAFCQYAGSQPARIHHIPAGRDLRHPAAGAERVRPDRPEQQVPGLRLVHGESRNHQKSEGGPAGHLHLEHPALQFPPDRRGGVLHRKEYLRKY